MGVEHIEFSWAEELFRLGATIAQETPAEVQRRILLHTATGFKAASGSLALLQDDTQTLIIVAGVDLPPHIIGHRIRCGEGIIGRVAASHDPLLLEGDISKDPRFCAVVGLRVRPRPGSAICWPLQFDNRLVGVLTLNRPVGAAAFTAEDIHCGQAAVNLMALVVDNARLQARQYEQIQALKVMNVEMADMNQRLEDAQSQLMQSEKMAAVGQLAAGGAHEINNPVCYVSSNLCTLENYVVNLISLINAYTEIESLLPAHERVSAIQEVKQKIDLGYVTDDISDLLQESQEGLKRVRQIVQDLKDFSHVDSGKWAWSDLRKGIDSTLNIVHNEIKYKTQVVKEYGDIPEVECCLSQLSQVFMNLLVNAAQAMKERGTIWVRTGHQENMVWVEIEDTGKGIPPEHLNRIFDPFFTTKPVGQGTGLGLSLSYGIVKKHGGRIDVSSVVDKGTCFRLWLPLQKPTVGDVVVVVLFVCLWCFFVVCFWCCVLLFVALL